MSKGGMAVVAAGAVLGGVAAAESLAALGGSAAMQAAGLARDTVLRGLAGDALAAATPIGTHLGVGAALNAADAAVTSGAPGGFHGTITEWLRTQGKANGQPIADAAEAADNKMEADRRKRNEEADKAAGAGVEGSLSDAHQGKQRRDTLGTKLSLV